MGELKWDAVRWPKKDGWWDSVFKQIQREKANGDDHWMSHFLFAKHVLRIDLPTAGRLADGYKHRALTPDEMRGLFEDFMADPAIDLDKAMPHEVRALRDHFSVTPGA